MSATGPELVEGRDCPLLIARLIADPATLETRLDAAMRTLADEGMPIAQARMLDACSEVLELSLPHGPSTGSGVAVLRRVIEDSFGPCDAIVGDRDFRIPDLFVSDMDSTMIGQECIDELADFAGIKPQIAAIT